jgi:hypothetical protein
LTEQLGASSGSVSDIFLPAPVARTIPIWSTGLVLLAIALHVRSALRSRRMPPSTAPDNGQRRS